MEPTVLPNSGTGQHIADNDRASLLAVAHRAVAHGTESRHPLDIRSEKFSEALEAVEAAFVSVYVDGQLRGCTGELEAYRSLVSSVVHNAHRAAFLDDRFPAIQAAELPRLRIRISVLTPQVPLEFRDENDLLRKLEPGVDGLTIRANGRQATFLPSVWDTVSVPAEFLAHLKHKAGLPLIPIPGLKAMRYQTENFGDDERASQPS